MLFFLTISVLIGLEVSRRTSARAHIAAFFDQRDWGLYRFVPGILAAIVVSLAIELFRVQRLNAGAHVPYGPWLDQLPLRITLRNPSDFVPLGYHAEFLALGFVQALLVGAYLLAMRGRLWSRFDTIASAAAALFTVALAVLSPAVTRQDMYAYVGDALLGAHAYNPPATALPGEYGVINYMWKLPLLPAAYGPTWLWLNGAVVGLSHGLAAKLMTLRVENVVALATILVALRRMGVAPQLIAATAINPAIAFFYLSDGHNDIVLVAIIMAAMTIAQRAPVLAGIVAGIGASMKLTFIVPAAAAAVIIATLPKRLAYVTSMVIVAVVVAAGWGGWPYVHALSIVAANYSPANSDPLVAVPHVALAFASIALTVVAVVGRRTYLGATFAFTSLAQAVFPWYAIWGFPYAIVRSDLFVTFLVGLPLAMAIIDAGTAPKLAAISVCFALLALAAMMLGRSTFARRSERALEV